MPLGKCLRLVCATISLSLASGKAWAGPPFLTDDPEPTEFGHWEVYVPIGEAEGRGAEFEGATGIELNYGAARNVQATVSLPVAYAHDARGWRWGAGDVELAIKYRFYHNEAAGLSIAVFPGMTLPTASNGMGAGRVTALLPVWAQKDMGAWSVFGGGGYAINPGEGNRNYWLGGIAVTRQVSRRLLLGAEVERHGATSSDGHAVTSLGFGATWQLKAPFRLLASGGPTFEAGGGAPGFHAFAALGLDF